MGNRQAGCVQRESFCAAGVGKWPAVDGPIINPLATDRRTALAKVNANLVGSTGFKAAFNQGEVSETFKDANMGYSPLSFAGVQGAATAAIASIRHQ
jgi:hypothetical protein